MERGANRAAAEVMLAAVAGSLEERHEAMVELVRSLADAVDEGDRCGGLPGESCGARIPSSAALWKEYRAAVRDLMEVADGGVDDDSDFLRAVRTSVGDRQN